MPVTAEENDVGRIGIVKQFKKPRSGPREIAPLFIRMFLWYDLDAAYNNCQALSFVLPQLLVKPLPLRITQNVAGLVDAITFTDAHQGIPEITRIEKNDLDIVISEHV